MSPKSQPHVAIVIVNYKGCADTLECLASIQNLTYTNFTVIVIDQDSRDGTPDAVRAAFAEVTVFENSTNDGFAAGSNRGINLALDQGAEYVFLLNNDTIVDSGLLEPLVATADTDPRIGVVGPLMLYYDHPHTVWSAGGAIGNRGQSRMREQGNRISEGEEGAHDQPPVEVDFVVGCGMLIKRALLQQIGTLDERFFLYYEEADFCARARRGGWRVTTNRYSRLWHKVSRSTGTESELTLYYMRRNVLLYLERNVPNSLFARLCVAVSSLRLAAIWTLRGKWRRSVVVIRATNDYVMRRFGCAHWLAG